MTQSLKQLTGLSQSEVLDLYQQYLDGEISFEQYCEQRRLKAVEAVNRRLAARRNSRDFRATSPDSVSSFWAGLLVGAAAYAAWRDLTRR